MIAVTMFHTVGVKGGKMGRKEERRGKEGEAKQDKTKLHWTGLNRERVSEPEQSWESLTKSRENNNKKKRRNKKGDTMQNANNRNIVF